MHFSKTAAILFIALSVAVTGCKKQEGATGAKQEGPGKGIVLAEVNGANITDKDFYKEQAALPPQLKPMTETPEGKKEMIDTMVVRELILQQASKDGIDKSPEVAAKLEDLKKRVIVEAFLKKKIEESAKVSDAEMQDYYNKNKDKFKSDAQIRASHILVKSEAQAKEIEKQLKGGASFEELAKKNSIDGAAQKGGDLGWFSKGSMIPDFEKVAFGLKDGEVSGIVKTQFGYHIIKKTGSRPAGARTLDEVKDEIKAALAPAKQQETFKTLKEDLKKQAKVSIKEDALKELGSEGAKGGAAHPGEAAQPAKAK
ncbi:peptidylprolyl isomerase [Geomonas anaerohicana]|uniref:peptidylprolyl isomerase n=1 Tax=Geomonas anaerohicana TaxID=2798583 RepID=A0ABS0Y952_9BACT|nr:peptidyl-prolyl cis-trans isomerase [Geomonas anaerohicana]MBJ6748824.1 peptidylprolyl isomerase [Geomonas anaerohicana]